VLPFISNEVLGSPTQPYAKDLCCSTFSLRRGNLVTEDDRTLDGLIGQMNEPQQRLFACDCAERALPLFEQKHPNNERPRHAIEVARRFVSGHATEEELLVAEGEAAIAARAAYDNDAAISPDVDEPVDYIAAVAVAWAVKVHIPPVLRIRLKEGSATKSAALNAVDWAADAWGVAEGATDKVGEANPAAYDVRHEAERVWQHRRAIWYLSGEKDDGPSKVSGC
jgi:hypothetical protein